MKQSVRQGLVDDATFLSEDDRQVAVGLAINWGMRLLLAYALDTHPPDQPSEAKDLAWLPKQIECAE